MIGSPGPLASHDAVNVVGSPGIIRPRSHVGLWEHQTFVLVLTNMEETHARLLLDHHLPFVSGLVTRPMEVLQRNYKSIFPEHKLQII